jgi:hypothetical protein
MIALALLWSLAQPPDAAGEVRSPEQVQADTQLRSPEQVQADPAAMPTTNGDARPAAPPNPGARPSEGVYAVGSGPLAPLPPPPAPVPASTIPKLDWRGNLWLSLRISVTGPLGGRGPAKPAVVGVGGMVEAGWRINQIAGLGTSLARQPHEQIRYEVLEGTVLQRGWQSTWDVAFVRLFAPVPGRVDPFLDLGGGLVFVESAVEGSPLALGGSTRASVGFDAWITKHFSLGLGLLYRASFVDGSIGHSLQGLLDISGHW